MKVYKKILLALPFLTICVISGCKKEEIRAEDEIQFAKLAAKTWQIHSLVVDGVNQTLLYPNLTLTFGKGVFTTTNGSKIWPASGTWSFVNAQATIIERGDGVQVLIEEVTKNGLKISMDWNDTEFGPGRTNSVSGHHVFSFK